MQPSLQKQPTALWRTLTEQGHGEALHHAAGSSQGEVALGVVDHSQEPPGQSCAQVGHGHVHQRVVERLSELPVLEGHDDHCRVQHDGRTREQGHDDGEDDEASAGQRGVPMRAQVQGGILRRNGCLHQCKVLFFVCSFSQ